MPPTKRAHVWEDALRLRNSSSLFLGDAPEQMFGPNVSASHLEYLDNTCRHLLKIVKYQPLHSHHCQGTAWRFPCLINEASLNITGLQGSHSVTSSFQSQPVCNFKLASKEDDLSVLTVKSHIAHSREPLEMHSSLGSLVQLRPCWSTHPSAPHARFALSAAGSLETGPGEQTAGELIYALSRSEGLGTNEHGGALPACRSSLEGRREFRHPTAARPLQLNAEAARRSSYLSPGLTRCQYGRGPSCRRAVGNLMLCKLGSKQHMVVEGARTS